LELLMRDADLRLRLGAMARRIEERYSVDRVLGQWNALIASVIKNGPDDTSPSRKKTS
jgi:hypothetical protein